MDDPQSLPPKVNIEVSLGSPISATEAADFKTGLHAYTTRLCAELGLPIEPVILVAEPAPDAAAQQLTIQVGGQECRQPHRAEAEMTSSEQDLLVRACEVVLLNRVLFVTHDLAESIHKRRFFQTQFNEQQVAGMAVEVIQLGFSLEKLTALTLLPQPADQPGASVEEYLETALDGFDTCEIKVRLGGGLADLSPELTDRLQTLTDEIFSSSGVILPPIAVETSREIPDRAYQFSLNGLYYPPYAELPTSHDGDGSEDPLERCLAGLSNALRANIGAFINRSLVEYLLASLGASQPGLVKAVNARWQIHDLTRILRRIAQEISIRDLPGVLNACVLCPVSFPVDPAPAVVLLAEPINSLPQLTPGVAGADPLDGVVSGVRANLRYQIWKSCSPVYEMLYLIQLDDSSLALLSSDAMGELNPSDRKGLLQAIYTLVDGVENQVPVILTSMHLRGFLRRMTEIELPYVPVLSYQDLPEVIISGAGPAG